MRSSCHSRADRRRRVATVCCLASLLHWPAHGQDADPALRSFARPAAAVERSAPLDREAWEPRLRALGQAAAPPRWRAMDEQLVQAASEGRDDDVRKLLARGAAIDATGPLGIHALGAASLAGWRSTVRLLLRANADPAALVASGQTALHLAAVAGQLPVIEEMLRSGVAVDLLNRQRETALDLAANANQQAVMDRLLEAGADTTQAGRR